MEEDCVRLKMESAGGFRSVQASNRVAKIAESLYHISFGATVAAVFLFLMSLFW